MFLFVLVGLHSLMAHNMSRRAARSAVWLRPSPHYAAFVLVLTCPSCRDSRELRIEPLIQDGRGGETTERFLMRLRCRFCANVLDTVRLQRRGGQAKPSQEMILVGSGAF